jgi:hypothetical protein
MSCLLFLPSPHFFDVRRQCYLGAIVVHLYAGKSREAWNVYQDVLGVDLFMSSDAALAAERLFDAYRTGEAEQVRGAPWFAEDPIK